MMRNKSNEDYARNKKYYEQGIQPYLDSNEYNQGVESFNNEYFEFRNKLPKDLKEGFDALMVKSNKLENQVAFNSYIVGFEEGKLFNSQKN